MAKIKYEKKEYNVRDSSCKKLLNICFVPFSGNGQCICRRYELGQCPQGTATEIIKQHKAMIQLSELRTGNLLNYDTAEGDVLPTKIDWQDLKWLDEDAKGFNLVHTPIPLTDEILVLAGFDKIFPIGGTDVKEFILNHNLTHSKRSYIQSNGKWFVFMGYRDGIEIFYLHQLQKQC